MAHLSSPGKWSLLMDAFCETSLSDALVSGLHEAGLWPCTQVRCSSGRQTPGILKSPSVSFGPVWISAGSSPRENRCDCTMILMSFCRKAPFKIPTQREKSKNKKLPSHPACFRNSNFINSKLTVTSVLFTDTLMQAFYFFFLDENAEVL